MADDNDGPNSSRRDYLKGLGAVGAAALLSTGAAEAQAGVGGGPASDEMADLRQVLYGGPLGDRADAGVDGRVYWADDGTIARDDGASWTKPDLQGLGSLSTESVGIETAQEDYAGSAGGNDNVDLTIHVSDQDSTRQMLSVSPPNDADGVHYFRPNQTVVENNGGGNVDAFHAYLENTAAGETGLLIGDSVAKSGSSGDVFGIHPHIELNEAVAGINKLEISQEVQSGDSRTRGLKLVSKGTYEVDGTALEIGGDAGWSTHFAVTDDSGSQQYAIDGNHTHQFQGNILKGTGIVVTNNNQAHKWTDSGGTDRNVLRLDSNDRLNITADPAAPGSNAGIMRLDAGFHEFISGGTILGKFNGTDFELSNAHINFNAGNYNDTDDSMTADPETATESGYIEVKIGGAVKQIPVYDP